MSEVSFQCVFAKYVTTWVSFWDLFQANACSPGFIGNESDWSCCPNQIHNFSAIIGIWQMMELSASDWKALFPYRNQGRSTACCHSAPRNTRHANMVLFVYIAPGPKQRRRPLMQWLIGSDNESQMPLAVLVIGESHLLKRPAFTNGFGSGCSRFCHSLC